MRDRLTRLLGTAATLLLGFALAIPLMGGDETALAQETTALAQETTVPAETATTVAGEEGTGTTVAGEGGGGTTAPGPTLVPAAPAEEPAALPEDVPWTYRYLVPTVLVIGGLAVVVTIIQYFVRVVRARYRPVR
jgi:hypothetical protein